MTPRARSPSGAGQRNRAMPWITPRNAGGIAPNRNALSAEFFFSSPQGSVLWKIIRVYCNARVTPPTLATQFGPPPRAGPPFPCPPHLHHFPIHATHISSTFIILFQFYATLAPERTVIHPNSLFIGPAITTTLGNEAHISV